VVTTAPLGGLDKHVDGVTAEFAPRGEERSRYAVRGSPVLSLNPHSGYVSIRGQLTHKQNQLVWRTRLIQMAPLYG